MLGWLGRLILGRTDDSDRLLFRFRDGRRKRWADPIVIERGLIEVLGREWRQVLRDLAKPPTAGLVGEQREEAEAKVEDLRLKVVEATRKAFGVGELSDTDGRPKGLTDDETLILLTGYVRFCNELIRAARPFASAQSRASPPSSPSAESQPSASPSVST